MKEEKVAVVSDIHSNIYALKTFLNYIEKYDIKRILNCGDFLQIGPNPKEVFDIVMNDERFINVLGNNELSLIERDLMEFQKGEVEHQNWVIHQLGAERISRVKELPKKRIVDIYGIRFLMLHTRLNSMIDLPVLYNSSPLEEYTTDYGEACEYVLLGHTHYQSYVSHWKGKTIINAGSLGCSKESNISFIIINVQDNEIGFEFKKVKYNIKPVIDDLQRLGTPDSENIIKIFFQA